MDLDLPDFKDTKSFTVGLRVLIYSFSAVYPTVKIAEIVFTQPRPIAVIVGLLVWSTIGSWSRQPNCLNHPTI